MSFLSIPLIQDYIVEYSVFLLKFVYFSLYLGKLRYRFNLPPFFVFRSIYKEVLLGFPLHV